MKALQFSVWLACATTLLIGKIDSFALAGKLKQPNIALGTKHGESVLK
tara:strand:+ start:2067 stop:2210 length:144 start_codon:yes stop_codon:yes gene_type:complete